MFKNVTSAVFRSFTRPMNNSRLLSLTVARRSSLDDHFKQSQDSLNKVTVDVDNDTKLKLYSLFKQATIGTCNAPKPGMMDFVGKAKWDAWNKLRNMTNDDAKKQYINVVEDLLKQSGAQTEASSSSDQSAQGQAYDGLSVKKDGHLMTIAFNRPKKYNAITTKMYADLTEILNTAAKDDSVRLVAFTGVGSYYCSGNDLNNFMGVDPSDISKIAKESGSLLENFVGAFINFPKPLIGLINGPAIGISVTVLGLFDTVYASDKATFSTPFTVLGQTPEGCSSFTFPRIMGNSKATDVLMFNRKLTAAEAEKCNLVSQVFPSESFETEAFEKVKEYSSLPPQSMRYQKDLVRTFDREQLHKVNKMECERLVERWQSQECMEAIVNFFTRKSKL
ncbi:DgyrCDS773 [Dimorphilus gyrociliatus]|uniref:DgyrCDS773 n=1 Tax=Dimorphilus gyrociliatus TaxID=2664684 RepID=A0A7I8V5N0_9ANNE|nr:DgyrCDS773 [Dimorphilus gyrociliatus]